MCGFSCVSLVFGSQASEYAAYAHLHGEIFDIIYSKYLSSRSQKVFIFASFPELEIEF